VTLRLKSCAFLVNDPFLTFLLFSSIVSSLQFPVCSAIALVDVDGDGQITSADLQAYWAAFKKIMTQAIPSSAGFGAGFLLGMYYA
jgi:hypothetical protein